MTHFLSLKEYLLNETNAKSPAGFATPAPGRASSINSFGENTSGPCLNVNFSSETCGIGIVNWLMCSPHRCEGGRKEENTGPHALDSRSITQGYSGIPELRNPLIWKVRCPRKETTSAEHVQLRRKEEKLFSVFTISDMTMGSTQNWNNWLIHEKIHIELSLRITYSNQGN